MNENIKELSLALPVAMAELAHVLSDHFKLNANYVCIVMLEFMVYTLAKKVPLELDEYLPKLLEAIKNEEGADHKEFEQARDQLFETIELVVNT